MVPRGIMSKTVEIPRLPPYTLVIIFKVGVLNDFRLIFDAFRSD